MKEYFPLNEACRANLNADKIILKCQPRLRRVFYGFKCHLVSSRADEFVSTYFNSIVTRSAKHSN